MKKLLAVVAVVSLLGCESTTLGPGTSWGTVGAYPLVVADAFFLASTATNGDYNFILIAADRAGYCAVLQQNLAGYPSGITYATITFSTPVGSGAVNPAPGVYPITAAPSASNSTAQASFGYVDPNCVVSPTNPAGTSGTATMSGLAVNYTQMSGSVNVGFGSSGNLSGAFNAPLCDTSQSVQGPSQCYQ